MIYAVSAFAALAFGGCENNDGTGGASVSTRAQEALSEKYPGAVNVSWEMKGMYAVADFLLDAVPNTAWFDNGGTWYMTESDLPFAALPQAVRDAFLGSEYGSWEIDDVDRIEREGVETVYVIEAELGEREVDLYYSPGGVLVKTVADGDSDYDYGDFIPDAIGDNILAFLRERYPQSRVVEIEAEDGMIEVEFVDGPYCREASFSAAGDWIRTKTGIAAADVPQTVMQALAASEYASWRIDDVDFYETPSGNFYRFELESPQGDVKVDVTPEGDISVAPDSEHGGNGLSQKVVDFISGKYPGAVITDRDYENGYLEVEIVHENREKSVYFDGSENWAVTEWDLLLTEVPAAVLDAVKSSPYASYTLDDADYVQTPGGDCYRLELERGESEVVLKIDPAGRIL